jgi:hypothetical protein
MAEDSIDIGKATWSQFLSKLREAGVKIVHTGQGTPYLQRKVGDAVLTTTLPYTFDEKNPDACGSVGIFPFYSVCRKLKIEPHAHFKGWQITL